MTEHDTDPFTGESKITDTFEVSSVIVWDEINSKITIFSSEKDIVLMTVGDPIFDAYKDEEENMLRPYWTATVILPNGNKGKFFVIVPIGNYEEFWTIFLDDPTLNKRWVWIDYNMKSGMAE